MNQSPVLRRALPADAPNLTRISFAAKKHWGYPDEWIDLWAKDLTIQPEYLSERWVVLAQDNQRILGFAALGPHPEGLEIDHFWVHPANMGRGLGLMLFRRLMQEARTFGASRVIIISDPHAVGFYEKMGARTVGTVDSLPLGRLLPKMVVDVPSGNP